MSSSHLTKKDLKNNPLTHEVEVGVQYVTSHRGLLTKAAIALGVILIGAAGYMYYSNSQNAARGKALFDARKVMGAPIGGTAKPGQPTFTSEEEKDKAVAAAFNKLASDYPGTAEAGIAKLYVASAKADKGDLDGAAADYRQVIDNAPEEFASTAKVALGQLLIGQGKTDEGKKFIQDVIDHPTAFVSSEQASLALARAQMHTNPAEARKILDPLTKSRAAISTVALDMLGQLPPAATN